jgi:hypothetical protein
MKPGEHPEFYRFPAPAGRSRESTIVLDRHGRFFHDGAPVEHVGLAAAFGSWVRRHPDDDRFILSNDYDWCYFTVEATPYFVTALETGDAGPVLVLSDGSREPLDPRGATLDEDDVLRVQVKQGGAEARFSRSAQLQLEPWIDSDAPLALRVGGTRYAVEATVEPLASAAANDTAAGPSS